MEKKRCPTCNASMMVNYHSMSLILVRALAKLVANRGKPIRELPLTKSEYANVSKLKHFGLVIKTDEDGLWIPTKDAEHFLRGEITVSKKIGYFRDRVVEREGRVYVDEILPSQESRQKYRDMMRPYIGEINFSQTEL